MLETYDRNGIQLWYLLSQASLFDKSSNYKAGVVNTKNVSRGTSEDGCTTYCNTKYCDLDAKLQFVTVLFLKMSLFCLRRNVGMKFWENRKTNTHHRVSTVKTSKK